MKRICEPIFFSINQCMSRLRWYCMSEEWRLGIWMTLLFHWECRRDYRDYYANTPIYEEANSFDGLYFNYFCYSLRYGMSRAYLLFTKTRLSILHRLHKGFYEVCLLPLLLLLLRMVCLMPYAAAGGGSHNTSWTVQEVFSSIISACFIIWHISFLQRHIIDDLTLFAHFHSLTTLLETKDLYILYTKLYIFIKLCSHSLP